MNAGPPTTPVPVPAPVATVAAGRAIRAVWQNELGGVTFEIGRGAQRCFVKWAPADSGVDLMQEGARLRWAVAFTSVPSVLAAGADKDGSWLVLGALPGESAVSARWKGDPARAVTALGQGLRAFHEALPVADCPFSWSLEDRLADIDRRAAAGLLEPSRWHAVHQALSVEHALELLRHAPLIDELVVCHGDTCAPNTLLADDGSWSGTLTSALSV